MTVPAEPRPGLDVFADLHVDVDGVDVQVTGRGSELTVTTDQPFALLRAVHRSMPAGGRRLVRTVADRLAAEDMTAVVHTPVGTQVRLGAGVARHVAVSLRSGHARALSAASAAVGGAAIGWILVRRRQP